METPPLPSTSAKSPSGPPAVPEKSYPLSALRLTDGGDLVALSSNDFYAAAIKLVPAKIAKPGYHWRAAEIPFSLWATVASFMLETYKRLQTEAHCTLFYHPENKTWAAWAFPQENSFSTVKTLENDEYVRQRDQFKDGWLQMGSVHHHSTMAAFASGVDVADEAARDGLHVTLGKMTSDPLDIHSRATFDNLTQDTWLRSWIGLPPCLKSLPPRFRIAIFNEYLVSPELFLPFAKEIPEVWFTNCHKTTPTFSGGKTNYYGYASGGYSDFFPKPDTRKSKKYKGVGEKKSPAPLGSGNSGVVYEQDDEIELAERVLRLLVTGLSEAGVSLDDFVLSRTCFTEWNFLEHLPVNKREEGKGIFQACYEIQSSIKEATGYLPYEIMEVVRANPEFLATLQKEATGGTINLKDNTKA